MNFFQVDVVSFKSMNMTDQLSVLTKNYPSNEGPFADARQVTNFVRFLMPHMTPMSQC